MNAKGGCGKTTVSTNLASFYARQGVPTALFDYDPQGSASRWIRQRPQDSPHIHSVAAHGSAPAGVTRSFRLRVPTDTRRIVIDTPAGFAGIDFEDRVAEADVILVPVLQSSIDIHSSADFIRDLLLKGRLRALNKSLGIIANRLRSNTRSLSRLERFLDELGIPVVARLRDTQQYLHASEQGLGIHELQHRDHERDTAPWQQLCDWLDHIEQSHQTESEAAPFAPPFPSSMDSDNGI
jgi:chromosome partitioning protein